MKTLLLVAAGLCVGTNSVWGYMTSMTGVLGKTDLSSAYWAFKSKQLTIADGDQYVLTFVNYNGKSDTYAHQNWYLELNAGSEYADFPINGDAPWGGDSFTSMASSVKYTDKFGSISEWNEAYNAAVVTLTISRTGNVITAAHTATCNDASSTVYAGTFTTTYTGSDDVNACIVAAGGTYQVIKSVVYTPNGGTSVTYPNVTYKDFDGSTPFTIHDGNRMALTYTEYNTDDGDKYASYGAGGRIGNGGIPFAYYDFSSSVSDASKVIVEFDYNIATVAAHELISISDADYHTAAAGGFTAKSNTGYGSTGAIFNLGCVRANSTQTFAVNTTQNSTLSACLDAWCHAKITVDNVNKTVDYVITNAAGTELTSASDVAFLNASAQKATQIDIYLGSSTASGLGVKIDNLTITKEVDESNHNYTINAVTSSGTTITAIAAGMAAEGEEYGFVVPKVVQNGGNYYVLDTDDADLTSGYGATFTMGNSDEVKEITYILDEQIVAYVEGGEASTNTTYSAGAVGLVASQNARCRGISTGSLSAGLYQIEAYFTSTTSTNANALVLRDSYAATGTTAATVVTSVSAATLNTVVTKDFVISTDLATSCINGNNLGDAKTYDSPYFDYVIIRRLGDATVSATITSAGYATFSSTSALDFSETIDGLTGVYYASKVESGSVTMTELNQTVPANTGLFLKGTANTTITIPVAVEGTDIDGTNYLKPTTEEEIAASANGTYHYVYAYTPGDVITDAGFYNLANAVTPGAGKAYLETTMDIKPNTASAKVSIMFVNSDATGISSINADSSVNADANSGKMYNLGGQRVGKDYKGIVIVNGKKYNQ